MYAGTAIRASVVFTDTEGAVNDPETVVVRWIDPDGAVAAEKTYGVDVDVVKDSAGHYHNDYVPTADGWWHVQWDGVGLANDRKPFRVKATTP